MGLPYRRTGLREVTQDGFVNALSLKVLERPERRLDEESLCQANARVEALWKEGLLRLKPIIRLENGEHIAPFRERGGPSAFLPPAVGHSVIDASGRARFVRRCLATDKDSRRVLEAIGNPQLDLLHEVLNVILPNYADERVPVTAIEEHLADVDKIRRAMGAVLCQREKNNSRRR